jgi:APA family basic amino acid/polyamine antiporter
MASTAIAAAAALSRVVPQLSDPWSVAMVGIATTIVVTAVNLRGVRAAGGFALVTVLIRILPLLAVIVVVLLREAKHQPLAPLAHAPITTDNIATAVTLTLFAIIGFETGTAPVGKVRNPTRTIPIALMAGTAFCVLLYLFSTTAVSLILSPEATAQSLAPFADALKANWGETAAKLAAVGIAIAAIGGLNSNLLCAGEVGYSMGLRGDLPGYLARTTSTNSPVVSLLLAAALTLLLVLLNTGKSTAQLFIFVSLLTTTATLVVYVFGAVAALRTRPSALATAAILLSILFSLFAFYGAGLEANLWGVVLLIAGLAIRWCCHRLRRSRDGSIPALAGSPGGPPGSSS